jgi:hypothetical protein
MEFSPEFPPDPASYSHDIHAVSQFDRWTVAGNGTELLVPDLRRMDILDHRMLVSGKRTTQLSDLRSLWEKIVLEKNTDEELGEENAIHPFYQPPGGPLVLPGPLYQLGSVGINPEK